MCLCERERERVCMCVWREERRGEEVGSGPLLLPWRPHPDAAAAVGASGRSEPVCSLEETRRAEEPPTQTLPATSKASGSTQCIVGRGVKPHGGRDLSAF